MSTYARDYTLSAGGGRATRPAAAAAQPATQQRNEDALYPDTRTQALSAYELRRAGIAANAAWRVYAAQMEAEGETAQAFAKRANVTVTALKDEWRHRQVKLATEGRASGLSSVMRADFRAVFAHFLHLAGLTEKAFELLLKTGKSGGSDDVAENGEQADHAITALYDRIIRHFSTQDAPDPHGRAVAWFRGLVAAKERKYARGWRSWSSKQKWQLYFTMKNRLQAILEKDGVVAPSTRGRNKSQRKPRQPKP